MDSEDTEWNDILREKGILPKKEDVEVTEAKIEEMIEDAIRERTQGKKVEDMDLDELDALLEDDGDADLLEDDRIVQQYRQKRIQEMQNYANSARFGHVMPLQKAEYAKEVNEASKEYWVVVYLFQDHIPACKLMTQQLDILAKKYPHTKFLKIRADLCIEGYPDKNCPTLIVYHKGELQKHLAGAIAGTTDSTVETLEHILKQAGALGKAGPTQSNLTPNRDRDDDEDNYDEDEKNFFGKSGIRKGNTAFTRVNKKDAADDDDGWG